MTGTAETTRLSPRNGFTVYFVLSPVSGLYCHRCRARTGRPDRRQGRGARTTRFRRTLPRFARRVETRLTPQASIATRATLRDDRETSLMAARADAKDSSDLRNCQEDILKFGNGPWAAYPVSSRRTPGPITTGSGCFKKKAVHQLISTTIAAAYGSRLPCAIAH